MANLGTTGKSGGGKEGSGGLRYPTNGKTIYHRPLNRSKTSELSQASFAYLFSEMVSYAQRRVTGIQDLEKRCGYSPLAFSLSHCSGSDSGTYVRAGSTSKATRSGSSCSTCSSSATRRGRRRDPSTSLRCCTSSRSTSGRTCLGGRPTGSRRAATPRRPTST